MTFNQYDVGATEQVSYNNTLESKLNVVDFGAIAGDGSDDLSAFQTAINRADREDVTTIYIPAGTYDLYGHLILEDNISLEGEEQNTTILVDNIISPHPFSFSQFSIPDHHIIRADNVSNIKIMNLTIMGVGVDISRDCIHFENVTNYTVGRTRLSDCGSGHNGAAIYAKDTSNGEVTYNIILSARNGYLSPHGNGSKNVFISNNTILDSRDDAIHPQTGSDNTIVGNLVRNSGDDNIDLWQENNALIENNIVVMHGMGGKIVDGIESSNGSTNVTIRKNQIMGPAGRGMALGDNGTNITITDNNLRDLRYGCMQFQNAGGVVIHSNRLSNC